MAYQTLWYFSDLPDDVVDIIEKDLKTSFDPQMQSQPA